jgi:hypothetical protein
MLAIWCELKQIAGFEISSVDGVPPSAALPFDNDCDSVTEKNKICKRMYTRDRKVNTQCTTKIK